MTYTVSAEKQALLRRVLGDERASYVLAHLASVSTELGGMTASLLRSLDVRTKETGGPTSFADADAMNEVGDLFETFLSIVSNICADDGLSEEEKLPLIQQATSDLSDRLASSMGQKSLRSSPVGPYISQLRRL